MLDGSNAPSALIPLDVDNVAWARRTTPPSEQLDRQGLRDSYYLHGLFEDKWVGASHPR